MHTKRCLKVHHEDVHAVFRRRLQHAPKAPRVFVYLEGRPADSLPKAGQKAKLSRSSPTDHSAAGAWENLRGPVANTWAENQRSGRAGWINRRKQPTANTPYRLLSKSRSCTERSRCGSSPHMAPFVITERALIQQTPVCVASVRDG